jgi:hypothetical protein
MTGVMRTVFPKILLAGATEFDAMESNLLLCYESHLRIGDCDA